MPHVLMHDWRDPDPGRAQFPDQGDGPLEFGPFGGSGMSAGPWYRVHLVDREPTRFGKQGLFRFDAPPEHSAEFQTCYVGCTPAAAFLETLGGIRPLPERLVNERMITKLFPGGQVKIANFTDDRVIERLGLHFDPYVGDYVHVGLDRPSLIYTATQQLARHLWCSGFQGIQYFTSHQQRPEEMSIALFSRPNLDLGDLDIKAGESEPINESLLREVQRRFGIEVFPGGPLPW